MPVLYAKYIVKADENIVTRAESAYGSIEKY